MNEQSETNVALRQATLWFRKNDKGVYEYNHIEDGHAEADKPTPKHANHSGWKKGCWIKEHVWVDGSVPARIVHDAQAKAARILAASAGA